MGMDVRIFCCLECHRQVTRGPSGIEYGHERARDCTGRRERCSRRPSCVDPGKPASRKRGVS